MQRNIRGSIKESYRRIFRGQYRGIFSDTYRGIFKGRTGGYRGPFRGYLEAQIGGIYTIREENLQIFQNKVFINKK